MSSDYPHHPPASRPLGGLQSVAALVEIAQRGQDIPENLRPLIVPIITAVVSFARTQHVINSRLWEQASSYPLSHASTHKGGADSVIGTNDDLVSDITLGVEGDAGTPQYGAAALDHVHGTEDLALLNDLEDVILTSQNSMMVEDVHARKLLEQILVSVTQLRDSLLQLVERSR